MVNKPNVRFKGFTDDWEQRKLGELVDFNPKAELPEEFEYVDLESVIGTEMISHRTENRRTAPSRAQRLARCGDLFYQTVRPYQKNNYLFEKAENCYVFSTGYAQMRPYVDGYFLLSLVQNERFVKIVLDNCTGTSYPAINANDLALIEVFCPSNTAEQQTIGAFFRHLDPLITLHQRKCDETKDLKKYMLQKMFPQNGKKIPEIRFAGFTDDWEQGKLGELVEKYENPVETPHDGYERLGIKSHAKGTFHSHVEAGKELETAKMHRVAADKFIVNITFAWEHAVAITDDEDAGLLVSHRFPQFSFHENLKSHFFKYVMLDRKFREHLELSSPGGAGRNRVLKINDMLNYKVQFPSVREQIKISQYFDNFDYLITLYQRKCDLLKEVKKFMLQNMFPQKG